MSRQGLVRLDPEFVVFNWRCEHIYGITAREAVGRPGLDVLPPLLGEQGTRIPILERDGVWSGVELHRHKDGRLLLVQHTVRQIRKRGQIAGYLARHQPITSVTNDYKSLTGMLNAGKIQQKPCPRAGLPVYRGESKRGYLRSVATMTPSTGNRIRMKREQAKLSKRGLARRAGVDERLLRRWEDDDVEPTIASIRKLVPHIGGTIGYYLGDTDQPDA